MTDELFKMMNPERMALLRNLSTVPRWVTVPTIQQQSVAEHTFNTMWVYAWVCDRMKVPAEEVDFLGVLVHDEMEGVTGDIPSTAKGSNGPIDPKKALLKLADGLEAFMFCNREMELGNTSVFRIAQDIEAKHNEKLGTVGGIRFSDWVRLLMGDLSLVPHPTLSIPAITEESPPWNGS